MAPELVVRCPPVAAKSPSAYSSPRLEQRAEQVNLRDGLIADLQLATFAEVIAIAARATDKLSR